MAVSHGERTLAAEWVALVLLITGDAIGEGLGGGKGLPNPSRYFASMVVFVMLAAFALAGEKAAKLASTLGGVALLAIALAPPDRTKAIGSGTRPLIVRFLAWLAAFVKTPPTLINPGQAVTAPPSSAVGASGTGPGGGSVGPGTLGGTAGGSGGATQYLTPGQIASGFGQA